METGSTVVSEQATLVPPKQPVEVKDKQDVEEIPQDQPTQIINEEASLQQNGSANGIIQHEEEQQINSSDAGEQVEVESEQKKEMNDVDQEKVDVNMSVDVSPPKQQEEEEEEEEAPVAPEIESEEPVVNQDKIVDAPIEDAVVSKEPPIQEIVEDSQQDESKEEVQEETKAPIMVEQEILTMEGDEEAEEEESNSTIEFVLEQGELDPVQNEFTVMEISNSEKAKETQRTVQSLLKQEEKSVAETPTSYVSLDYFLLGLSICGIAAAAAFVYHKK